MFHLDLNNLAHILFVDVHYFLCIETYQLPYDLSRFIYVNTHLFVKISLFNCDEISSQNQAFTPHVTRAVYVFYSLHDIFFFFTCRNLVVPRSIQNRV